MDRTSSGVLKKDTVKMAEGRSLVGRANQQPARVAGPAARILNQTETGVLIEVTCACGERTQLQCDYASEPSAT
jgi:hypothetical protein